HHLLTRLWFRVGSHSRRSQGLTRHGNSCSLQVLAPSSGPVPVPDGYSMSTRTRSLSRTLIAVTAATAPVVALAPTAQAAPAPQVPRTPLPPALPTTPLPTVPLTPSTDDPTTVTRWVSVQ